MNKELNIRLSAFVVALLILIPSVSLGYPFLDEAARARLKDRGDVILAVGDVPSPPPSRRQIIDADKGAACLQCHHMPYPIAPQKPEKRGEEPLSSIQVTAPGGLRIITPAASKANQVAGGWSPDGKQIIYSINLYKDEWDIWVLDADGKNRRPLVSTSAVEMAPDWRADGRAIVYQSNRAGNNDIWIMDIASNKQTPATSSSSPIALETRISGQRISQQAASSN
jgi:dipeptidyl aminopeptidase/acylaminoacyl peptidase